MANVAPELSVLAEKPAPAGQTFDIVLQAISPPALDDIRIEDSLFAIGRTEQPFVSYAPDIVTDLSRRHARIFTEFGAVYIADLDSKNGTTVNGLPVRQKPSRLRDGDEISFGRQLSFRVRLSARASAPAPAKLVSLTLDPERSDLGLGPIVITRFPFLVSKNDEAFARCKVALPHQVNYISRRHAHIFLKNGAPFVEDLGSTNGTFLAGQRLDEHAVALHDSDLLAFGGHHLAYRVSLQQAVVNDPTVTKLSVVVPSQANAADEADKTTFVAAPDTFLDIFCIDHPPQADDALDSEAAAPTADLAKSMAGRRKRGKFEILIANLRDAIADSDRLDVRRALWWTGALTAALMILSGGLYMSGARERELKGLMARGEYARAAIVAGQWLEHHPDRPELKALDSEALLKATLPNWLALLKAGDFGRAAAALGAMKTLGAPNPDLQPLLGELEWIGDLERFVAGRGVDAPIQMFADEAKISALLKRWDENSQGHQRAFSSISAHVPEFRDRYAEVLSHLRRLQSDDAVYMAAIERLKTLIGTELKRDRPEALEAILQEYAEKYPRLGGLDAVRQDLRQYSELDNALRARRLGPLVASLAQLKFATPPFQERWRALTSGGQLPSSEVVAQYQTVAKAWRAGDTKQTTDGLQKLAAGPWVEAVAEEAAHKKAILEQFAELQQARGSKAYDERLLAFYGALDPKDDIYFIGATAADLALIKDKALKRAQGQLTQSQALWGQYRDGGAIEGAQRLDATISIQFRTQARRLAEANDTARQAVRLYTQLKVDLPAAARETREALRSEAERQRNALLELHGVLEPAVLKAKLAMIGGQDGE